MCGANEALLKINFNFSEFIKKSQLLCTKFLRNHVTVVLLLSFLPCNAYKVKLQKCELNNLLSTKQNVKAFCSWHRVRVTVGSTVRLVCHFQSFALNTTSVCSRCFDTDINCHNFRCTSHITVTVLQITFYMSTQDTIVPFTVTPYTQWHHIWLMTVNWSPTLVIVGYGWLTSTHVLHPRQRPDSATGTSLSPVHAFGTLFQWNSISRTLNLWLFGGC